MEAGALKKGMRVLSRSPNGNIYYVAKITDILTIGDARWIKVHYEVSNFIFRAFTVVLQGWGKRHDEFVQAAEVGNRLKAYSKDAALAEATKMPAGMYCGVLRDCFVLCI